MVRDAIETIKFISLSSFIISHALGSFLIKQKRLWPIYLMRKKRFILNYSGLKLCTTEEGKMKISSILN
jgi:hypothetical protein